jgi:hypothetical protein
VGKGGILVPEKNMAFQSYGAKICVIESLLEFNLTIVNQKENGENRICQI